VTHISVLRYCDADFLSKKSTHE